MNNAYFSIEKTLQDTEQKDVIPALREREVKLTKVLEAIDGLRKSKHWSSLKEEVFDGRVEVLKHELSIAARKDALDIAKIAKAAGRLEEAETYHLETLERRYKNELLNIKKQLYG